MPAYLHSSRVSVQIDRDDRLTMAAKTPDSIVTQENFGSLRLIIARFSTTNLDNADTYTTGLTNIVGRPWFVNSTTTGVVGCEVSGGVITFATSADNLEGDLYILTRS